MKVFCPALLSGKYIPPRFASKTVPGGQNTSPPISWSEIPSGTKSFALSIIDRDPSARGAIQWLVANIPHWTREIAEGASDVSRKMPVGSVELRNREGSMMYKGPDLPKGSEPHEYLITVYALSVAEILLGSISPPGQFDKEIAGKVIEQGSTIAIYQP